MASGTLKWISQLQMTMCAPRCLNLSNYFFFLFFFSTMVTHLNLLDVFRAQGQKSFYIHKGLWITENCIKLSNLITVSTKHNRYLQPYGEREMGGGGREEERERNQKCRQCPFIMLMQCMYWRRRLRNVCVCVCVYVGVGLLPRICKRPMRAFENA